MPRIMGNIGGSASVLLGRTTQDGDQPRQQDNRE